MKTLSLIIILITGWVYQGINSQEFDMDTHVSVRLFNNDIDGYKYYTTNEEYTYAGITVPAGFITDGASVPWYLHWYATPEQILSAGVVHDYLYFQVKTNSSVTKQMADDIFFEVIQENTGRTAFNTWFIYKFVNVFAPLVVDFDHLAAVDRMNIMKGIK